MGQYYRVVNLDKREFLETWDFGDGAKLLEFGCSGSGIMCALAILLADGNGRGGGDLDLPEEATENQKSIVGSWAGDRIVVSGDYADKGRFFQTIGEPHNLFSLCEEGVFLNISEKILEAMCFDSYLKHEIANAMTWRDNQEIPACLQEAVKQAKAAKEAKSQTIIQPDCLIVAGPTATKL